MYLKCMVPKAKGLLIKLKYQKFQASISKRDVKIKMIKTKKPNEKLLTQCNQVYVGGHICSFLQMR